jgi:HK97 family phage prohead protease
MSQTLFLKALKSSIDETQMVLNAVVGSTGVIDRQGESVNPKGWLLDNYLKNPVILYAHNYAALPIGKALRVWLENDQLMFTIQFAKTDMAQEVFQLYKDGFLSAFSVGFIPRKMDETGQFTFAETELLELSAVPVPANPQALALSAEGVTKIKSFEEKFATVIAEAKPQEETPQDLESVPVEPTIEPEQKDVIQKVGRTLSAKHEGLLRSALDGLTQVLSSLPETSDDKMALPQDDAHAHSGTDDDSIAVLKALRDSMRTADKSFGQGLKLINDILKAERKKIT